MEIKKKRKVEAPTILAFDSSDEEFQSNDNNNNNNNSKQKKISLVNIPRSDETIQTNDKHVDKILREIQLGKSKFDRTKFKGEYIPGSIVRMKFHNFLTYDDVEFSPGPRLNVIFGPNGSGKSSIVCGMALSLGSSPNILGRAKEASEFIRHGADSGWCEIELEKYPGSSTNIVIRRHLSKEKSSEFKLNGNKCSKQNILLIVKTLGIQIENLCQFLPQDKVVDFAKMSPEDKLKETERALDFGGTLLQMHYDIVEKKKELDMKKHSGNEIDKEIEDLERRNEPLKREVEKAKERELLEKKIQQLKIKRVWRAYEEQRLVTVESKEKKKKTEEKLNQYELKNRKPLLEKIKKVEGQLLKVQGEMTNTLKNQRVSEEKIKHLMDKMDDCEEKKTRNHRQMKELKTRAEERKRIAAAERRNIERTQEKLAELPSAEEVQESVKQNLQEKEKYSQRRDEIQQKRLESETIRRQLEREKQILERQLRELSDQKLMRQNTLFGKFPDLKTVYEQIRHVEQEGKMNGRWYVPFLEIECKKDSIADYIEHSVNFRYINSILCESPLDRDRLTDWIKRNYHGKVHTTIMVNGDIERTQGSIHPRDFNRFQIEGYLIDLFNAPDLVKLSLDANHVVGKIIVTKDNIDSRTLDDMRSQNGVQIFFANGYGYSQKVSRYSAAISTSETRVKPAKILRGGSQGDKEKEQHLRQKYRDVSVNLQEIEEQYNTLKQQEAELTKKLNEINNSYHNLMRTSQERSQLLGKIKQKEQVIQELEQEEDYSAEEEKLMRMNETLDNQMLQTQLSTTQAFSSLSLQLIEYNELTLKKLDLTREKQALNQEEQNHSQELIALRESVREAERETRQNMELLRQLKEEAEQFAPLNDITNSILQDLTLPNDVDEIQSLIGELETKAQMSRSKNPNALIEYQKRCKEIELKHQEKNNMASYLEKLTKTVAQLKAQWLPRLNEHVQRLDEKFGKFLQLMGNSGAISLNTDEVGEDAYDKYALNVKVAFRSGQSLENLNAKMQSGGERSVSTMLFLIAMQDVTQSPFRLVDEINQGMDPHNERAIFQLVADYAVGKGRPQYFLVTPKLLPDLNFTKDMTILCILNGPFLDEKWDPKGYFSKIERHE